MTARKPLTVALTIARTVAWNAADRWQREGDEHADGASLDLAEALDALIAAAREEGRHAVLQEASTKINSGDAPFCDDWQTSQRDVADWLLTLIESKPGDTLTVRTKPRTP